MREGGSYLSDIDEPMAFEHSEEHVEPKSTPEAKDRLVEKEVFREEAQHPKQVRPNGRCCVW